MMIEPHPWGGRGFWQAQLMHQAFDAFMIAAIALRPQLRMNAWTAIGQTTLRMHQADFIK